MLAFLRANKINHTITSGGRDPKIGIITTGKSYLDVRQAFDELGIDEVKMQRAWASGFTRSDARGRSAGASLPNSPPVSISSSSSRRSAR